MGYVWHCQDDSGMVTAGLKGVGNGALLQANDGYGGYNVNIPIKGSAASYHVHFHSKGREVNVVRYKASSTDQGSNIVKFFDGGGAPLERKSLRDLAVYCNKRRCTNHARLLMALHIAFL